MVIQPILISLKMFKINYCCQNVCVCPPPSPPPPPLKKIPDWEKQKVKLPKYEHVLEYDMEIL